MNATQEMVEKALKSYQDNGYKTRKLYRSILRKALKSQPYYRNQILNGLYDELTK